MIKMMNLRRYMGVLLISLLSAILFAGCTQDECDLTMQEGEGSVSLSMLMADTRVVAGDEYDEVMEQCVVKIYSKIDDSTKSLIRRYDGFDEMPESLYLISGEYMVTILVGGDVTASFDKSDCTYYGESDFTVTEKEESTCEVTCMLQNTLVEVAVDSTIGKVFSGYTVTFVAADEYSDEAVKANGAITLKFTSEDVAYFYLEEGANLAWRFTGVYEEGVYVDGVQVAVGETKTKMLDGVISQPQIAQQNTLNFSYYAHLSVSSAVVEVDDSTNDNDDSFSFIVQPVVAANFDSPTAVQIDNGVTEYSYTVSSLNELDRVVVSVGGDDITLYENNAAVDAGANILYAMTDSKNGVVTIKPDTFNQFSEGGNQSIDVKAYDINNAQGLATLSVKTTGLKMESYNLWSNDAVFSATNTRSSDDDFTIEYREVGSADWITCEIEKSGDYQYSATTDATWSSATINNLLTYRLESGIEASRNYECRLVIAGEEFTKSSFTTSTPTQSIPNADFESSLLSCWGTSNSSSTSWSSGNNSSTSSLCTQGSKTGNGGSSCAYLAGEGANFLVVNILAAGNICLGTFSQSGTSGTVSFGQKFKWEARPRSIKFKYAASLGTVDYSNHAEYIDEGSKDQGRIFFAIVNWSSRHGVTSGTDDPSGVWDPVSQKSTDEGAIIGYASMVVTADQSTMKEQELEVYYYDKETKPSKDVYSIVISCATSRYGDYMNGSSSSKMWVDDFAFGY